MKSVLISIRPQWCENIASDKKTIEVRKTAPKEVPFKVYIYCSKEKKQDDIIWAGAFGDRGKWNEHVIGEFICDKVERFSVGSLRSDDIEKLACLSYNEMISYFYKPEELDGKTTKQGFAWHISDLKIYDKPKELSEFCIPCKTNCGDCKKPLFYDCWKEKGKIKVVTRPPQSYMFVEEICRERGITLCEEFAREIK